VADGCGNKRHSNREALADALTSRRILTARGRDKQTLNLLKGDSNEKTNLVGHAGSGLLNGFSSSALERKRRLAGDDLQR
jgi:hypothetical protein